MKYFPNMLSFNDTNFLLACTDDFVWDFKVHGRPCETRMSQIYEQAPAY